MGKGNFTRAMILFVFSVLLSGNSYSQILKMKSTLIDIERPGRTTVSKDVTCYHTIDYSNKQVIYEGISPNGEKVKITYIMKRFYKDGVTDVIVVNDKGVKEFWFSSIAKNLGYDYFDGTRLAFYNLTTMFYQQ